MPSDEWEKGRAKDRSRQTRRAFASGLESIDKSLDKDSVPSAGDLTYPSDSPDWFYNRCIIDKYHEYLRNLRINNLALNAEARKALSHLGPRDGALVPPLIRALSDKRASVRADVAMFLGLIGPSARAAIPELSRALGDKDLKVRRMASEALAKIDLFEKKEEAAIDKALTFDQETLKKMVQNLQDNGLSLDDLLKLDLPEP